MTVQKTADIDLSGEIICATEYVDGEDRWIVLTVEHDDPILGTRVRDIEGIHIIASESIVDIEYLDLGCDCPAGINGEPCGHRGSGPSLGPSELMQIARGECQQCGHIECCCDPEVAPWIHELRRLREENAALSAGLDRALAFLSDCRAENDRLLEERVEYREYRA